MIGKKGWIGVFVIVATLGATGAAVAAESAGHGLTSYIGKTKAKEIALQTVQGKVDDVELERKRDSVYYEVEVIKPGVREEVDVHVDAASGKVLKVVHDDDRADRSQGKVASAAPAPSSPPATAGQISAARASEIAAKALNGTVVEVERDRENGVLVYEVKLKTNEGYIEVKVAAADGKVISTERDDDDDRYDDDRYDDHDNDRYDDHDDDDRFDDDDED